MQIPEASHIANLQERIKTAEGAHESAPVIGKLWLSLADEYERELRPEPAKEALAHALGVLHGTSDTTLYANAVNETAAVYAAAGRVGIAEKYFRRAIALRHTIEMSDLDAETHTNLAVVLIVRHKYLQALNELSIASRESEVGRVTNVGLLILLHIARSRALCGLKRCGEGLQELDEAQALGIQYFLRTR